MFDRIKVSRVSLYIEHCNLCMEGYCSPFCTCQYFYVRDEGATNPQTVGLFSLGTDLLDAPSGDIGDASNIKFVNLKTNSVFVLVCLFVSKKRQKKLIRPTFVYCL